MASNLRLKVEESQHVLEIIEPIERLKHVNQLLSKEMELSEVQARIQSQAKEEMSKTQREYFLREQLRAIQQELGEVDEKSKEIDDYQDKIDTGGMPEEVKKEATKQIDRLRMMHQDSAEANIIRTYLDWMTDLPWGKATVGQARYQGCRKDPGRGPLWPGKGQAEDPGISGGAEAQPG